VVEDTTTTAGVAIAESVPNQVVEDTTTTAGEVIADSFPSQVVEDVETTTGVVITDEEPNQLTEIEEAGSNEGQVTGEQSVIPKELRFGAAGFKNTPVLGKRKRAVKKPYQEGSGSESERDP
jgi:predicted alternative tryptophan synthase beta-subunit